MRTKKKNTNTAAQNIQPETGQSSGTKTAAIASQPARCALVIARDLAAVVGDGDMYAANRVAVDIEQRAGT